MWSYMCCNKKEEVYSIVDPFVNIENVVNKRVQDKNYKL